jgi:hypothetical protein
LLLAVLVAGAGFHSGHPDLHPAGNTHFVRVVQKYPPDIFVNQRQHFFEVRVGSHRNSHNQIKKPRLTEVNRGFLIWLRELDFD